MAEVFASVFNPEDCMTCINRLETYGICYTCENNQYYRKDPTIETLNTIAKQAKHEAQFKTFK